MKVTDPVAVVVGEVTVAVNVIAWPSGDGFSDDFTVLLVVA